MEMQTDGLRADGDLVSQVLEIIGGATYEVLQSPEEPEDSEAWLAEEGDDSVFYSDEDQGHKEAKDERVFIRGSPEVEEDRTEAQTPNSDQSGAKHEAGRNTGTQMENTPWGPADPLDVGKALRETSNLRQFLPKLADADVPAWVRQRPGPGYTTLPTPKTSFNHLTSSKYDTVSFRRIRRGNTRQKIEKFEYMILNL